MAVVTDIDLKNNFDRYLSEIENGTEIILTKNGKKIGKFIPNDEKIISQKKSRKSFDEIMNSLTGILNGGEDYQIEKEKYLREKYGFAD